MHNTLTVIKVVIVAVVFCTLLPSLSKINTKIEYGYTDLLSYFPGDTVSLYFYNSNRPLMGKISLTDINGTVVDQVSHRVDDAINKNNPWQDGFGYSLTFKYVIPDSLKSGIYLWNDDIPMVVKDTSENLITVVYPTINNLVSDNYRQIVRDSLDKIHLFTPKKIDPYSRELIKFMQEQDIKGVNHITDLELENISLYEDSKLIIIYGDSKYWTNKSVINFEKFIDQHGNALIFSSTAMNNQIYYKKTENVLVLNLGSRNYFKCETCKITGGNYNFGGYPEVNGFGGFKITSESHPIFNEVDLINNEIKINSHLYSSNPGIIYNEKAIPEAIDNLGFFKCELIGYERCSYNSKESIGSWFVFQKTPASGAIMNFGTKEWLLEENLKQTEVKQIIKNSIKTGSALATIEWFEVN